MDTRKVIVRLPEKLITHADVASEVMQKNRTELLIEALREYIEDIESDEDFRESVVKLYLTDKIDFETLELIIGRQDAKAVQSSKRLLDDNQNLLTGFGAWDDADTAETVREIHEGWKRESSDYEGRSGVDDSGRLR